MRMFPETNTPTIEILSALVVPPSRTEFLERFQHRYHVGFLLNALLMSFITLNDDLILISEYLR